MRTRNAGTPKTPASQKKTPSAKKSAAGKSPASIPLITSESSPDTVNFKELTTPQATPSTESKPDPPVEQPIASAEKLAVSSDTKEALTTTNKKKVTRTVKKKVVKPKTPASAKGGSAPAIKPNATVEAKLEEGQEDENASDAKNVDLQTKEAITVKDVGSVKCEELDSPKVDGVKVSQDKGKAKMDVDEPSGMDADITRNTKSQLSKSIPNSAGCEELIEPKEVKDEDMDELPKEEIDDGLEKQAFEEKVEGKHEILNDEQKIEDTKDEHKSEDPDAVLKQENVVVDGGKSKESDAPNAEEMEDYGDEEGFVEPGEEDLQEDDEPEAADEVRATEEVKATDEVRTSDEEHKELAAAAKERKIKKELEIFVGGLDREVVEDDVKKAFETVGEVVEVRLLKDPSTNRNRGFAFVRFATKDQTKRALSEMKNPVIRGKRCGAAPNEDNDTLFLGNICNTWTKEAVKQKLKDYNVEGIESITLVQDPRHEGLSRGFCFIHFACHADAMFAYKRLQKPDAIFGHAERTAKVAFAEPLQEPDPEVMAKVKSVFVDGLPPFWDEDRVRKHFKTYGEIDQITLARNMSTSKRKDFGFVDYTTHEAAIACIEDLKNKELVDGNAKMKVKARLSNPQPKTQAVKGGMCGGFRIGRPSGKNLGHKGPQLNRPNFQHGRSLRGQYNDPIGPYGRRGPHRGARGASDASATGRHNFGGPRRGIVDRGFARPRPSHREPFPLEDVGYSRPFMGREYDDPYFYDDSRGIKRPFYMADQDPAYMEPSRVRPRFDYSEAGRGTHFGDTYGAGSSLYSSGYYGPDYGPRSRSSFDGPDRPYGGGSGYYY